VASPSSRGSEFVSPDTRTGPKAARTHPEPGGPQPDLHPRELLPRLSDIDWIPSSTGHVLPLTMTQYRIMQAWERGDFINDLNQPVRDDELLPEALTRVSLEACLGAALYPGIEVGRQDMHCAEVAAAR
jgi:hypothetical protein